MKSRTQAETRSEVIFRHTKRMLHEQRCSMQAFAMRVVDAYHAMTPLTARTIEFKTEGDLFRCATTNAQHLARWMDQDISARMPVDIEEAWIAGLSLTRSDGRVDHSYRDDCIADLLARQELLMARVPEESRSSGLASIGRLSKEFGEALQALAPILEDGRISGTEVEAARVGARELRDLIGVATEILTKLEAATSDKVRHLR